MHDLHTPPHSYASLPIRLTAHTFHHPYASPRIRLITHTFHYSYASPLIPLSTHTPHHPYHTPHHPYAPLLIRPITHTIRPTTHSPHPIYIPTCTHSTHVYHSHIPPQLKGNVGLEVAIVRKLFIAVVKVIAGGARVAGVITVSRRCTACICILGHGYYLCTQIPMMMFICAESADKFDTLLRRLLARTAKRLVSAALHLT